MSYVRVVDNRSEERHQLLDAIQNASDTGIRQIL
jgi:hypothetical protein